MTDVLGPAPTDRSHRVVIAVPDWADAEVAWLANVLPEAGTVDTDLISDQPSDFVGYDISSQTHLIIRGTRADAQPLDVVSVILANATADATWTVQVGNSINEAFLVEAADVSGNARHGLLRNGPVFTAGVFEGGLDLTNPNVTTLPQYVTTPAHATLQSTVFTYMAWVRPRFTTPTPVGVDSFFVSHIGAAGAYRNAFFAQATGKLTLANGVNPDLVAPTAVVPGVTYHIAIVYDGTTARIVIDGTTVAQSVGFAAGFGNGSLAINWFGANGFTNGFDGMVDDLRYYKSALTDGQIQAEMQSETPTLPASLAVQYTLNAYQSPIVPFGMAPNLPAYPEGEQRRSSFLLLPYRLTATIVHILIYDTATPIFRLGRVFIGTGDQPSKYNYDEGYSLTLDDDSKATRTPSGQTLMDGRPVVPGLEFSLERVPRSEALLVWLRKYQARVGTSLPLLVCLDPEAEDSMEALFCYGHLKELTAFSPRYYNGWVVRWAVEALL